jgi:hypothetical protein
MATLLPTKIGVITIKEDQSALDSNFIESVIDGISKQEWYGHQEYHIVIQRITNFLTYPIRLLERPKLNKALHSLGIKDFWFFSPTGYSYYEVILFCFEEDANLFMLSTKDIIYSSSTKDIKL